MRALEIRTSSVVGSMNRQICVACFAITAALLSACSRTTGAGESELARVAERFVPVDATDRVVAKNVPWAQVDFVVRRVPFDFAFDERVITGAVADGWLLCRPKSKEWWEYEDRSVTPARYLQQRVITLFKNDVLVTLLGRYASQSEQEATKESGSTSEKPPQQGVASARRISRKEAAEIAEAFDLSCGAG
jgi:hypothetical protein